MIDSHEVKKLLKLLANPNNWGFYDESGCPKSYGNLYDTTWVGEDHPGVIAKILLDSENVGDNEKNIEQVVLKRLQMAKKVRSRFRWIEGNQPECFGNYWVTIEIRIGDLVAGSFVRCMTYWDIGTWYDRGTVFQESGFVIIAHMPYFCPQPYNPSNPTKDPFVHIK